LNGKLRGDKKPFKANIAASPVASALPESCHPPRQLKRSIFLLFVALELQAESSIPVSVRTTPPLPVSSGRQPDVRVAGSTKPAILLLEITVNGLPLSGVIRAERMNGNRLVLPAETWIEARLKPAGDAITLSDGRSGYALEAAPGVTYLIDTSRLTLQITAPATAFEATSQSLGIGFPLPSGPRQPGVYLTYDASYTGSQDSGPNYGALLEGVAFGPAGALVSDVAVRNNSFQKDVTRTETYWRFDRPGRMEALVIGDTISSSAAWSRPARYGGIRYARDFNLAPGYITYPIPSISGSAALPSTIDVLINNRRGATSNIQPGPFDLTNIPIVTGAGQVQVVVRDLLGRETVINQSYYQTPVLLAKGLSDFSYEAGSFRENFGTRSNDYGTGFGAGTYRRGITDHVTAQARVEAQRDRGAAGADLGVLVGEFFVIDIATGYAKSQGEEGGHYVASAQRATQRGGASVSVEHFDEGYRQFGDTGRPSPSRPKNQVAAQAGLAIGSSITTGMTFTQQTTWDGDRFTLVGANIGVQFPNNIFVSVSASKELSAGKTWSGGLNVNVPLGTRRTISLSSASDSDGRFFNTIQATQTIPSGPGWGWRVGASDDPTRRLSAGAAYNGSYCQLTAEATGASRTDAVRLGANGSLEWMGGSAFASRRIDAGAFAVVHVGDVEGVPVMLSNQVVAVSDRHGQALVTGLYPYQVNALTLNPDELPLDVEINGLRETVVPFSRSGVFVNFPVKRSRNLSVVLRQPDGTVVPAGAVVTVTPGDQQFIVAKRGEAYLTDLAKQNQIDVRWKDGGCMLSIAVPPLPKGSDAIATMALTCGATK
jgi:outer membrane usher protein